MNHKLEVLIYLIGVLNSVYDKVLTIKPICEVPEKVKTFEFLPSLPKKDILQFIKVQEKYVWTWGLV